MADSDNTTALSATTTRRALLAGAVTLAGAGAVAFPAQSAPMGSFDDGPLFELLRQRQAAEVRFMELDDRRPSVDALVSPLLWTPKEMAAHRIRATLAKSNDKPRVVDLEEIGRNDWFDSPLYPTTKNFESEDDVSIIYSLVVTSPKSAPAEDMAAWKARCAGRRALYDAKLAASARYDADTGLTAIEAQYEAADEEHDRLKAAIVAYSPQTMAGVLAKMREVQDWRSKASETELYYDERLFLSAMSDLERLSGAVPVTSATGGGT